MRTFAGRPLRIHSCLRPYSGESLLVGSHSRHCEMKLTKESSGTSLSFTMIYFSLSSFCCGVSTSNCCWPAFSFNWENKCFLYETWRTLGGTMPITSMMSWSCSLSLVPGKRGKPVKSSIMMQPMLHMSMACV